MNIVDLLKKAIQVLKNSSDTPQLDAEVLLSDVLKISRSALFLKNDADVSEEDVEKYESYLNRRSENEPIAYILKRKDFYKDSFYVDSRVLVPRPETEILVENAVNLLKEKKGSKVLDICCGSGCIGLSIKRDTDCDLVLSDVSEDALEVAGLNAENLFSGKEIKILHSDLFSEVNDRFDLITANPPYLSQNDMKIFCKKELKYEPEKALFSGNTGFEVTEKIIEQAPKYLNGNGLLMLELGYEGSQFLQDTEKLKLLKVIKDLAGIERIAVFTLHR